MPRPALKTDAFNPAQLKPSPNLSESRWPRKSCTLSRFASLRACGLQSLAQVLFYGRPWRPHGGVRLLAARVWLPIFPAPSSHGRSRAGRLTWVGCCTCRDPLDQRSCPIRPQPSRKQQHRALSWPGGYSVRRRYGRYLVEGQTGWVTPLGVVALAGVLLDVPSHGEASPQG